VYDYLVMYFFLQGIWHKVSYRRFAHILVSQMKISRTATSEFMTFVCLGGKSRKLCIFQMKGSSRSLPTCTGSIDT
jgi:hypothetical protein